MTNERRIARAGQQGLTLLEVLAAVALLGLVYTALATKATQGVMSESDSLRRFHASLLADERLAEIETIAAMKETPDLGRSQEESEDGIFQILTEVTEWTVPVPPVPEGEQPRAPGIDSDNVLGGTSGGSGVLLQALVRVTWNNGIGERSVERVTFVLDQERLDALAPDGADGDGS
jgi:prepilin-type N-terminal cleavage/methylation domain-containing protein